MRTIFYYVDRVTEHILFRQLSWYTVGQIAIQLFSFLGVIVTSRYLGPTNVGLYSFVQNYLALFMTITIGMDFYFTWKVAKSDTKVKELVEYFGHKLNVTLVLTFIGVALAWLILPQDVALMATIMFVPLVFSSCTAFFLYAVATNKANTIALFQVGASVLLFITKIVLVFFGAPLIAFIIVNAVDTVLVVMLLGGLYLSKESILHSFKESTFPTLFKTMQFMYSVRMSLIAIALWQLILRVDQLVLATFSNAYTLGIYSAAVKIAEVPNFLAGVLYTALVSHVALFASKEDNHSKRRVQQVLLLYAFIGVVTALFLIFISPLAISLLYGEKFIEAVPVLQMYALSVPGMFVTLHYFGVYGAKEKHFLQAMIFLGGLLLNIALIYILSPLYGLSGAALATSITYTVIAAIFYSQVR